MLRLLFSVLALTVISCKQVSETPVPKPVVISSLGISYFEPVRDAKQQTRLDSNLQVAQKNFDTEPSEENFIWLGRRTGYLMRIQEAIDIYSRGLEKFPTSYKLLRHRGHRYISLRQFDQAIEDLARAEELIAGKPLEVEPDGIPNRLNQPLSTTQFNIFYHLALAHYLKGDYSKAEETWKKCLGVCNNDDSRIAVIDWLYMTLRREGKSAEAAALLEPINDHMDIIENDSYYARLKMYKGWLKPEDVLQVDTAAADYNLSLATQGYGVGNWYLYQGDSVRAREVFKKVLSGKEFAAFGFIAAEAEIARTSALP